MADENPFPSQDLRPRPNPAEIWEQRTAVVKREVEAERAAIDAKTAKLRALRLAKEAADSANNPEAKPKPRAHRRKSVIRVS